MPPHPELSTRLHAQRKHEAIRAKRKAPPARREQGNRYSHRSIPVGELQRRVLADLKGPLLTPGAVAEFVRGYRAKRWRLDAEARRSRGGVACNLARLEVEIEQPDDVIADGTDTPAMRERLKRLEAERSRFDDRLRDREAAAKITKLRPELADFYRTQVADRERATNADEATRTTATKILRGPMEKVVGHPAERSASDATRH